MEKQGTGTDKVVNLADKRWENVFSNDLQKAFNR